MSDVLFLQLWLFLPTNLQQLLAFRNEHHKHSVSSHEITTILKAQRREQAVTNKKHQKQQYSAVRDELSRL
jgi:hypothetical protein